MNKLTAVQDLIRSKTGGASSMNDATMLQFHTWMVCGAATLADFEIARGHELADLVRDSFIERNTLTINAISQAIEQLRIAFKSLDPSVHATQVTNHPISQRLGVMAHELTDYQRRLRDAMP